MKQLLTAIIILIAWSSEICLASEDLEYLGSFTFTRSTESGHSYVSEFRLWSQSEKLYGVYLDVAGLGGDPIIIGHKITSGVLRSNGDISLETKWYKFEGRYHASQLDGVLKQGDSVIWGGNKDSNKMSLKKGISIKQVEEKHFGTIGELTHWIDSFANK